MPVPGALGGTMQLTALVQANALLPLLRGLYKTETPSHCLQTRVPMARSVKRCVVKATQSIFLG